MGVEASRKFSLDFSQSTVFAHRCEDSVHAVVGHAFEILNLAFALHQESHGNTLNTSCRELWFYLAPQHRRQFESHQSVQHTPSLLSIHQIHVQLARMLDSLLYRRFRDFVEDDTVCLLLVQSQDLAKVP